MVFCVLDNTVQSTVAQEPMLLLTGPTGVGKTATIRSLAGDLRCEVQEWTNPVLDAFNSSQTFMSDNRGQQYYYVPMQYGFVLFWRQVNGL